MTSNIEKGIRIRKFLSKYLELAQRKKMQCTHFKYVKGVLFSIYGKHWKGLILL